ncbi:MAG: hypothetical protein V3T31_05195 [candidate division Zixibacteria bacterium]
MIYRAILILATITLAFSVAAGQYIEDAGRVSSNGVTGIGVKPAVTPFSLLDMSRIKWSHSYSVSFFSGGRQSGSVGLASSSMLYEFSKSLSVSVNVGLMHDPSSLIGHGDNNGATFLPGFSLSYHPSENFHMTIQYQRYEGRAYPYQFDRYYRRGYFGPD